MGVELEAPSLQVRYDIKKSFSNMAVRNRKQGVCARRVLGES